MWLVGLVLLLGFVVRLYRFTGPVADWHSWRQADTSAVSWYFVYQGFDILHPKYFDISNVQSGFDNPNGYRFVEFPIYNIFQAGLFNLFHIFTLEEWGRVVTIFSSLMGSLFLFLLLKRRSHTSAAWFSFLFSLFLPYNIYYGRTILPDISMVATMLAGLYFLDMWLDAFRKKETPQILFILLATLFTAASFLLKAYTLFYALAMVALVWSVLKWKFFTRWELYIFAILSVAPFAWWRHYILAYPEGIPVNAWLFNGNGIRFRPAFFRWILYERLTKLIAGYVGDLFLLTGIWEICRLKKDKVFLFSFILSAVIYVCVIATGNVQHDYYQIVIMPAVAMVMGFGASFFLQFLKKYFSNQISLIIVGGLIVGGLWLSWLQVQPYFDIDNIAVVYAGQAVDKVTPKNAKVLAPYNGDTTLLYYTKRQGWPSFEHSLPELIKMGAGYMVLVNPTVQDIGLGKQYKIISQTKDYLIFDLHKNP